MNKTYGVLTEVHIARVRQDHRWGEQDHRDGSGSTSSLLGERFVWLAEGMRVINEDPQTRCWSSILLEEVFEAVAENDPDKLRAELLQAAAVAVAWIEALDHRQGR